MSFLVAGFCVLSSDHLDYPDVFPGGWFTPPVFGDYTEVFPGGWFMPPVFGPP